VVGFGFAVHPFGFRAERLNGFVRLVVAGELDLSTAGALDHSLEQLQRERTTLIVDLGGLEFMGVAGVRVFVAASRRAWSTGGSVLIVNCSAATRRVFELTSTSDLLDGPIVAELFDDDRDWTPMQVAGSSGPRSVEDR
jgi:anti-sigma B factor antagonist